MPSCLLSDYVEQEGRFLFKGGFNIQVVKVWFANVKRQRSVVCRFHVLIELRFKSELSLNLTFYETEADQRVADASLLLIVFIAEQPHIFKLFLAVELEEKQKVALMKFWIGRWWDFTTTYKAKIYRSKNCKVLGAAYDYNIVAAGTVLDLLDRLRKVCLAFNLTSQSKVSDYKLLAVDATCNDRPRGM